MNAIGMFVLLKVKQFVCSVDVGFHLSCIEECGGKIQCIGRVEVKAEREVGQRKRWQVMCLCLAALAAPVTETKDL